ncbi:MAG: DUF1850 domain-containing protein [Alphaproteobacteria bacterium]|nr:DUF1850 domain-containing protein [Alphaproteobacteria bacterium]
MSTVCLLAGVLYTLVWTHSVEKIEWQEDWRAEGGKLILVEARVQGSGAGMEPGEGAVLKDGVWRWQPRQAMLERVVLTQSPYVTGYLLCSQGDCRPLGQLAPEADKITLTALGC